MKRPFALSTLFLLLPLILSGCNTIGSKAASMSWIYGTCAALSLLLLVGYCTLVRKRDSWFLLLFTSVLVVNIGYFSLSISSTLEEALLANRIAYLGSVFLPLTMLINIMNVARITYRKWLPIALLVVGIGVFLIAASPGYLDIYYKEVALAQVNGSTVLNKVYGPWHCVYLFYLLAYFAAMITIVVRNAIKNRIGSTLHALILAMSVFVNLGVWLLEQFVKIDFEILSISYIISELFLLVLYLILQEQTDAPKEAKLESDVAPAAITSVDTDTELTATDAPTETASFDCPTEETTPDHSKEPPMPSDPTAAIYTETGTESTASPAEDQAVHFTAGLGELTHTERTLYHFYLEGKSTKEILAILDIKENTLKYHNKNLYSKLGVSSRKQLVAVARAIDATDFQF